MSVQFFVLFYYYLPVVKELEQKEDSWLVVFSSGFQIFSNIVFSLYCKNLSHML